ncbi:MAG: hypothetical protein FJ096_06440 [Deltaproteobacteria bacterium]|nr:hypothetical protein [Deltaproteobacteria bacterium]
MSLGSFYEAGTELCGFRPNHDEGKTMGLAPYGDPARFDRLVGSLVAIDEQGGVHLDLRWFDHPKGGERRAGEASCARSVQPDAATDRSSGITRMRRPRSSERSRSACSR